MIETENQKLIRQNKQYREKIAFLENEIKKLSLSLNESRSKLLNLQSTQKLQTIKQSSSCEGTKDNEAIQLDFIVPNFLQGKVSDEFLRDIKNKKKLTKETMNLSLESISYNLKNKIDEPKGSLEYFIDVMIKENVGFTSYKYLLYLDASKSGDKTKDSLDSKEEKDEKIKEEARKAESHYEQFELLRKKDPDFMKQFIPRYCQLGFFSYENQGTPSYNDWVLNWLKSI